jgi:hypothetical protein
MQVKGTFNGRDWGDIRTAIVQMQYKHEAFEPCPFTQAEIMELFVEPDDHNAVLTAGKLFGGHSLPSTVLPIVHSTLTEKPVTFQVSLSAGREFGFPKYAGPIVAGASRELRERFVAYCHSRIEIALAYGLVYRVFEALDQLCKTPSQVAFFWPSIRVIADALPGPREMLAKKPKSLPIFPPALREACALADATIAMHQMLGTPPDHNRHVRVSFASTASVVASGPLGEYGHI